MILLINNLSVEFSHPFVHSRSHITGEWRVLLAKLLRLSVAVKHLIHTLYSSFNLQVALQCNHSKNSAPILISMAIVSEKWYGGTSVKTWKTHTPLWDRFHPCWQLYIAPWIYIYSYMWYIYISFWSNAQKQALRLQKGQRNK